MLQLPNSNLHLSRGEWVLLLGESGAGKSMTAQRLLDQCMALSVSVSWVPQQVMQAFPPSVKVGDFIRHATTSNTQPAHEQFRYWAEQLQLDVDDISRKTPQQCSGGMLQRAALALAFSRRKPWIIADEPTSALDAENRRRALQVTAKYVSHEKAGVLWITHHEQETLPFAHRVLYCQQGQLSESSLPAKAL